MNKIFLYQYGSFISSLQIKVTVYSFATLYKELEIACKASIQMYAISNLHTGTDRYLSFDTMQSRLVRFNFLFEELCNNVMFDNTRRPPPPTLIPPVSKGLGYRLRIGYHNL